jgi:hypothetical protein
MRVEPTLKGIFKAFFIVKTVEHNRGFLHGFGFKDKKAGDGFDFEQLHVKTIFHKIGIDGNHGQTVLKGLSFTDLV